MSAFALPSRALVAPARGLGGVPLAAPWWRSLVGSALAAGAVRWRVRASARSFSGAVIVAGFRSCGAAVAFAAAWSWWCGCAVALRRRASGGSVVWAVSVPVAWPGGRGGAGPPHTRTTRT
ncbi:hypothetical protein, partial [Thiococcus pfennigii]|uniref:hypothetical protein n=1 Tax=Thiococcus pfennigii TaxID=1057 RepID=UPI00190475CA